MKQNPEALLTVAKKIIVAVSGTASYSFQKEKLPPSHSAALSDTWLPGKACSSHISTRVLQSFLLVSWYSQMPRDAVENDENPPMCLKLFKFLSYREQENMLFFASEEVNASVPIGIFKRNSVHLLSNNFMRSAFLPFAK